MTFALQYCNRYGDTPPEPTYEATHNYKERLS